jgi:RloB-like protein
MENLAASQTLKKSNSSLAMSKKKRVLRKTIFIACEGKNTEPNYFEAIKELVEEGDEFAIIIYPDKTDAKHSTHALGLVEEARSRMEDFDEVWAVFDKDGYTKHKEAFALAADEVSGKKVNIAFSSISFEQWILLHFEKSSVPFPKSQNITDRLIAEGYFPLYEKTSNINTYSFLKDRTLVAFENTAWLNFQLRTSEKLPAGPLHELNPYTDVDTLVKRLLGHYHSYQWSQPGVAERVGNVSIMAELKDPAILIQLSNLGTTACNLNAANINRHFILIDVNGDEVAYTLKSTVTIEPGKEATLELTALSSVINHTLNFLYDNIKLIIVLV